MANFLNFVILLIFIKHVYTADSLSFATDKEFFDFLEQWTLSGNVEEFRSFHSNFSKQLMNVSANPCEDFYNFACGNFESVLPQDSASRYYQTTDINFHFSGNIFNKAVQSEVTGDEPEFLLKAKNFFRSCLNDDAWVPEVGGNFLKNFAKWPLLNDDWSESDFDWLNVSAKAAYYGYDGLFRHATKGYNSFFYDAFSPVWLDATYLGYLRSPFQALSVDLNGKQDQLQEISKFTEVLRNLSNDKSDSGERKLFKVSELEEEYPNFDAFRFLKIVHRRDDLSPDMSVLVTDINRFHQLNELIASTDKRIIANFILSQLAINLVPKWNKYNFPKERENSCLKVSKVAFYFGLASWFRDTYITKENQQQIDTLKKTVQDGALAFFGDKENIVNMKNHIFFPVTSNVSNFFISKYKYVTVDPNDFYTNWLQVRRILKLKYMIGWETDLFLKGDYTWLSTRPGLVVPVTLFIPPFFHEHAPEYYKYGTLGSYLSHQFYKVFSENQKTYRDSVACLKSLFYGSAINKTCAATEGVALALTAYKDWLAKEDSHAETMNIEFNGRLLDGEQGLLLSYAQSVCVKRNDATEKINQAFSEFSEFRQAYGCH